MQPAPPQIASEPLMVGPGDDKKEFVTEWQNTVSNVVEHGEYCGCCQVYATGPKQWNDHVKGKHNRRRALRSYTEERTSDVLSSVQQSLSSMNAVSRLDEWVVQRRKESPMFEERAQWNFQWGQQPGHSQVSAIAKPSSDLIFDGDWSDNKKNAKRNTATNALECIQHWPPIVQR